MIKLKELKDLSVDQLERMVIDIHKEISICEIKQF